MLKLRLLVPLTLLALLAFAANSVLCRLALHTTAIDPASFTSLRLLSGALMLGLIAGVVKKAKPAGSWQGASALFVYAATFSFAYIQLDTGAGALLLFGAVQITMISFGWWRGERFSRWQIVGFLLAVGGLLVLLLPGAHAPAPLAAGLMLVAGIAWGVYSLLGRGAGDPTLVTAGNFLRAAPLALLLSLLLFRQQQWDSSGVLYALLSGAITSGCGYAIWYTVLPALSPARAASLQLSVPVIATLGGALFLQEIISLRQILASVTLLGGVALVVNTQIRR